MHLVKELYISTYKNIHDMYNKLVQSLELVSHFGCNGLGPDAIFWRDPVTFGAPRSSPDH